MCKSIVILLMLLSSAAIAQTTQEVRFEQSSPISSFDVQHARYGLTSIKENLYKIANERFWLRMPAEDDSTTKPARWGLLVWCSASQGASVPREYLELLSKKKLICITAYGAGNDRPVGARIGLALDAVFNLRQRYPIDDHRIYIAGVSGGGKIAGIAALAYPDLFDGAISCAGMTWYANIPVPGKLNTAWPATFRKPPAAQVADAREHVGFALIAGDKDQNHDPVKAVLESGFKPDGYKHATFFEVPGLGHSAPPAERFEKAIDFLDEVPKSRVKKLPTSKPSRPAATTRP